MNIFWSIIFCRLNRNGYLGLVTHGEENIRLPPDWKLVQNYSGQTQLLSKYNIP